MHNSKNQSQGNPTDHAKNASDGSHGQPSPPPLEVPLDALSPDALAGVIDSFILREGTDYGVQELSHEAKVERIQRLLLTGKVKIVFDPSDESVTLLTLQDFLKLKIN
jgi:uncharacterized protein YheU (UPF0270 family)